MQVQLSRVRSWIGSWAVTPEILKIEGKINLQENFSCLNVFSPWLKQELKSSGASRLKTCVGGDSFLPTSVRRKCSSSQELSSFYGMAYEILSNPVKEKLLEFTSKM